MVPPALPLPWQDKDSSDVAMTLDGETDDPTYVFNVGCDSFYGYCDKQVGWGSKRSRRLQRSSHAGTRGLGGGLDVGVGGGGGWGTPRGAQPGLQKSATGAAAASVRQQSAAPIPPAVRPSCRGAA